PPRPPAIGALLDHITGGHLDAGARSFQPMNINYGLLPPIDAPSRDDDGRRFQRGERGRAKKRAMSLRALTDLERWIRTDADPEPLDSAPRDRPEQPEGRLQR